MHLEIQLLIDIRNERQHQFGKSFNEERIVIISIDAFLIFKMYLEKYL